MEDELKEIRELAVGLQCESSAKDPRQKSFTSIIELVDSVV